MLRTTALISCMAIAGVAIAQPAKWEPPPTPEGWKAIVSKDDRYRFALPKDTKGSGTRDRTITVRGLRATVQVNYCTLKDGTTLEVA